MSHRFVVLGCGSIGKRHIRNLIHLGVTEIVAVDPTESRRAEAAELGIKVAASFEEALASRPTACVIASPNKYHRQDLENCLSAKLHTLVEKPLAVTSEGLEAIVSGFEIEGLVGHVGTNFKFHPSFVKMREVLPTIGKVYAARAISGQYLPDWHPWEDYRNGYSARKDLGGGVLLDTHELLYMTWFLGPGEAVASMSSKVSDLEIDTEDLAQVMIKHEGGAISTIQADYLQRTYQRNYEFTGSEGFLRWDVNERAVKRWLKGTGEWTIWEEPRSYDLNQMYVEQTKQFLSAIEDNDPAKVVTPLRDGLAVLKLTEACKRSNQDMAVVTL